MGVLFNANSYGELSDTPANDGAAAMIGALASEAVGWVVNSIARYKPELVERMIAGARIGEVNALANLALSTSLHRNLTEIAARVTSPAAIAYYDRLVAQAAADMNAARGALANALGLPQSMELVDLARKAYGEEIASVLSQGVGTLAGAVWTAAKLKEIIDNPDGKSPDEVATGYRKELVSYSTSSISELTNAYRSFIATGSTSLESSMFVRWAKPQTAPAAVVTGTTGARALWVIARTSIAAALSSLAFEGGWLIGSGSEISSGFKDLQIGSRTLQDWVSTGLVEPIMVTMFEDPRARSEAVAMLAATISRVAPRSTPAQFEALLNAAATQDDPLKESVAIYAQLHRIVTGERPAQTAATSAEFSRQVAAFLNAQAAVSFEGSLFVLPADFKATHLAHRYALTELNGFAVEGLDYSRFNANGELDMYDPATGRGNLTAEWIQDRTALLSTLVAANTANNDSIGYSKYVPVDRSYEFRYVDPATGAERILIGENTARKGGVLVPVPSQLIYFGRNSVIGTDNTLGDRLYGASGADSLNGKSGADHLEGNAGNDTLNGGTGDDVLFGGSGSDTYQITKGEGRDVIIDSDGQGSISLDGVALSGGRKVADDVWEAADKSVVYTKMGGNLIISERSAPGSASVVGTITVKNWQANQLGITLEDDQLPPTPADHTYTGDYIKQVSGQTYVTDTQGQYVSDGASPGAADVINASVEDDRIEGLAGNDGISGFAGDDSIFGGDGDDLLLGGFGADTIEGGIGADEILGSGYGPVTQPTATDFTPPSSNGHPELARGFSWVIYDPQNGTDTWVIDGANALPVAETTGNVIDGGAGNDRISAGSGSDTVHGGEDDDWVVGMGQSDVLFGDSGNDQMLGDGSPGANAWSTAASEHAGDYMDGGVGNDVMVAQGGDDVVFGDEDNDHMYGDDLHADRTPLEVHGNDYLDGENGNDTLVGGGRNDVLFGGANDDVLYGDGATAGEVIDGYSGADYLDGEDGNDLLVGGGLADEIVGGGGNDTLLGDAAWVPDAEQGNDYLDGAAGDDQLRGYSGDDQLFGGTGLDTLQGDAGNDYLDGEDDDDVLVSGDGNDSLFGGGGKDQLFGGINNDQLRGEAGKDKLYGEDGDDYLDGGDDIDTVSGGNGNDTAFGGAGNDQLLGGAGLDVLDGEAGNDEVQGGADADKLYGGGDDDLLAGQAGDDLVTGDAGNDQVQGNDGNDVVAGGEGNDLVAGQAGDDQVSGDAGNDELQGDIGKDVLNGGEGHDFVFGQADSDTLDGGAGNDHLEGGEGADVYVFGRGSGRDAIYNQETTTGSVDVLQFGVKSTEVQAWRNGDDLVIGIDGANDTVTLKYHFSYPQYRVEQFKFTDGLTWSASSLPHVARAILGSGATTVGTTEPNVLIGTAGSDTLAGDTGNDIYRWGYRSGRDTITETYQAGQVNTIALDASVQASDVALSLSGSDIVLSLRSSPDQLTVKNAAVMQSGFYRILLADGQTLAINPFSRAPATEGADAIVGTAANESIDGLGGNDTITGGGGLDTLRGSDGDDKLTLSAGQAYGDAGHDDLTVAGSSTTLRGGEGNDTLTSNSGSSNTLYGEAGEDVLVSTYMSGSYDPGDILIGGTGNDRYYVGSSNDEVVELAGEGIDTVFASGHYSADENVENLVAAGRAISMSGNTLNNVLTGSFGDDSLSGYDGADTLDGGGAHDWLYGGAGDDTYVVGWGSGQDSINHEGTTGGQDRILLGSGITASDLQASRQGNDLVLVIIGTPDLVRVVDYFASASSVETVQFADGTTWNAADIEAALVPVAVLPPKSPQISIPGQVFEGTSAGNSFSGTALDDTMRGYEGNDWLEGGAGYDSLVGGSGDDTYYVDSVYDAVVELPGGGNDTLRSGTSVLPDNVEYFYAWGSTAIGNSLDNYIYGGASSGSQTLIGGAGNDTLEATTIGAILDGGTGNDTYILSDYGSPYWITAIDERPGEGIDEVFSLQNVTLWANVEHVTLLSSPSTATGNELDNRMTGNSGRNTLTGGAGNDTLTGMEGIDSLAGGMGDDSYVLDAEDSITEYAGEGSDTVIVSFDYSLVNAPVNIENLTITGNALTATGNAGANVLTGNALANTLDGALGADTMAGGSGDDTYIVDNTADVTQEQAGGGIDLVKSGQTYTLSDHVENLTLTGTANINGTGNAGNNVLTGNSGSNVLTGGAGDDTYVLTAGDTVVELEGGGTDTIKTDVTRTLGTFIENGTLTGTGRVNLTGNAGKNVLVGNTANNTLDGGADDDTLIGSGGTDALIGRSGNDYYVIDDSRDSITEGATEGIDTVEASFNYTLGTTLENLVITGAATTATGNALKNVLTGNGLDNRLDGLAEADTMAGGAGNDTYVVDNAGDVVVEQSGEGTDVVQSSVNHTLGANVENLTLIGTAYEGVGNALANLLTGTSAANRLVGGGGDDTYMVTAGDLVVENAAEGIDTVQTLVTRTLEANVENLTLTGSSVADATGNALDNVLTGNSANNKLTGGLGDDTYVITVGDTVVENANEGVDTIRIAASFSLAALANIENLTLLGTSTFSATGNDAANVITGNAAANVLAGGKGDDTYYAGAGDTVNEAVGEGYDTVYTDVTLTVAATIEKLVLMGNSEISGTTADGANTVIGNASNNTLDGGLGGDTMMGGHGNDTYVVESAGDVVIENADEGDDTVRTSFTYTVGAHIENVVLTGTGSADATGDESANLLTGSAGNNVLAGLGGNDTLVGGGGADMLVGGLGDDTYVYASGAVYVEEAAEGTDTMQSDVTLVLQAAHVENVLLTGTGNINATGSSGNNVITGTAGANVLEGGGGADTLHGGAGNDTLQGEGDDALYGGAGDDTYIYSVTSGTVQIENENAALFPDAGGIDTVLANADIVLSANGGIENATLTGTGSNRITGNAATNVLTGNAGHNVISGGGGSDRMDGGAGNDTVYGGTGSTMIGGLGDDRFDISGAAVAQGGQGGDTYYFGFAYSGAATITELAGEGIDTYDIGTHTGSTTVTLADNVENLTMLSGTASGNASANLMKGYNVTFFGLGGNDTLDGSTTFGNGTDSKDTLHGGQGDDTYYITASDVIVENANEGVDTVRANYNYQLLDHFENLTLVGGATQGTGNALNNVLTGGFGADTLRGLGGDDTYMVSGGNDSFIEEVGGGTDTVVFGSSGLYSIEAFANIENLTLTGVGGGGTGNSLNNVITAGSGFNTLDGGLGVDTLKGGAGDDTYIVDRLEDVIVENAAEGFDTVQVTFSYTLTAANVERILLTGSNAIDATGSDGANTLTGNNAANVLRGGKGDDTYVIDNLDTMIELLGEGTDTVQVTFDYELRDNVENLVLLGSAVRAIGNGLNNTLTGNATNNYLAGGIGDDTYIADLGDTVFEDVNAGTDTVRSSTSWTLGANLENLVLLASANSATGTGNTLNNVITGNASSNTIDGAAGADTLLGGAGDDRYIVDNAGDVVTEYAGEGTDTVVASVSHTLLQDIENLELQNGAAVDAWGNASDNQLTGNSGANVLRGYGGNDSLNGAAGADSMFGGDGNDVYTVDNSGDQVTELTGGGTDTVLASVTYSLGSEVEILTLTAAGTTGTGNEVDNILAAQNGGANTLSGGAGNDTYLVDATDVVNEDAADGIDTVQVNGTYTLGATLENLTLTGSAAANGTGNALNNRLDGKGNTAGNILAGGAGDDTYIVGAADTVVENAAEGFDVVYSSVTFTLSQNVEDLVLTDGAVGGFGNADANRITGNSASNVLDGQGGADTLVGGAGDDSYTMQNATTTVLESASEGKDVVVSTVDYALSANVEELQLSGIEAVSGTGNASDNAITGNVLDNLLTGGAGADTLNGSLGADTLIGGTGNDTYEVDNAADVVVENAGEGTDTVRSRHDYVLGENVENLEQQYGAVYGTGNAARNVITGNTGDNILDGAGGADTLLGGDGDDTYLVDALDTVQETASGGTDTVVTSFDYTLGSNLENLALLGSTDLTGTGNAHDNLLTGNDGTNLLAGADGKDTLDGGLGADTLQGGNGADTYVIDNAGDAVVETGLEAGDTVLSAVDYALGGTIENLQLTGAAVRATGNAGSNVLIGNDGNNLLDGGAGADEMIGGWGNDAYIVDTLDDWVAEYEGEGIDEVHTGLATTLAVNVEILTITSTASVSGTGNAGDNLLRGNGGANVLDGAAGVDLVAGLGGNDTLKNADGSGALDGGAGDDTLTGVTGAELFAGGMGNDTLTLGGGADIVSFRKGDGEDVVVSGDGVRNDTLSLGGVQYSELRLARDGADLLVKVAGTADAVRLQGWYTGSANQGVAALQVMVDTTVDYAPGSGDVLRDARVKTFDFAQLVSAFDSAIALDPQLTEWTPDEGTLAIALTASSDTHATGGHMAWQLAHEGTIAYTDYVTATAQMGDAAFGNGAQEIAQWQDPQSLAATSAGEPASASVYTADSFATADSGGTIGDPTAPTAPTAPMDLSSTDTTAAEGTTLSADTQTQDTLAMGFAETDGLSGDPGSGDSGTVDATASQWAEVDAWASLEPALSGDGADGLATSETQPATITLTSASLSDSTADLQTVTRLEEVTKMDIASMQG